MDGGVGTMPFSDFLAETMIALEIVDRRLRQGLRPSNHRI